MTFGHNLDGPAGLSAHADGCGPDCAYRALYEGSQTSLSDMAAKQAVALRRLGHFRAEVVRVMKRTWPQAFRQVEQRVGGRMSELPDDVVIAYLDGLVQVSPDQVGQLRELLTRAGMSLPASDNLADWIVWLREHPVEQSDPVPSPAPSSHGTVLLDLFGAPDEDPNRRQPERNTQPVSEPNLEGLFPPEPSADPDIAGGPDATEPDEASVPEGGVEGERPVPLPEEPAGDTEDVQDGERAAEAPASVPPMDVPHRVDVSKRIRPEPTRKGGRRQRKQPRTKATPPDPTAFDVPPDTTPPASVSVDEDTHNALQAAVAIPRPVFTSDLAAVAGSQDAAGAWERSMRELGTQAPVRFIPSKSRHQARGSLVLPHAFLRDAASEFTKTWWAGCIEKYRGGRLYELAVLLHRVGEDVVGYHLDDETVVLRLNQRRGLVGVVVTVGTEFGEGEPSREALISDLESLFTERLGLIAVLTTRADTHEQIDALLEQEARSRGWSPAMPVVTSTSWQWADSSGTAARAVLGGAS